MSVRTVLIVFLALGFGLSAAYGVVALKSPPAPATVPVLVAAVDIPAFGVITPNMVTTRDYPREMVPADVPTKVDDVLDRDVLSPLKKGDVLFGAKLAPRGAGHGLVRRIPPGMRAFAVYTPGVVAGVAGFIMPGNRVDVMMRTEGGDATGPGRVVRRGTLLRNIEVLAVEQRTDAPAENKVDPNQLKSVTLLVTPTEVEKLNDAESRGKLYLSLRSRDDPDPKGTAPVLVAAVDIRPFGVITPDMVKKRNYPRDLIPPGAITSIEEAVDRVVLTSLWAGEPLLGGKLAPRGAGRGLAARIPRGKRAFAIHTLGLEAGVAGFILPGDHVDVVVRTEGTDSTDRGSSPVRSTLLQNIEILAVEQREDAPAENKVDPNQLKSVTLLVTPTEVEKLNDAESRGKLYLSLRSRDDTELVSTQPPPAPKAPPAPVAAPAPPPPVSPPPLRIRTMRGNREGEGVLLRLYPAAPATENRSQ